MQVAQDSDSSRYSSPEFSLLATFDKNKKDQLTLITCDNFNEQTGIWEDRKIYIAKHEKTNK